MAKHQLVPRTRRKAALVSAIAVSCVVGGILLVLGPRWRTDTPCDACDPATQACYTNPVLTLGADNLGDPAVAYYNGTYYLVGTGPGHYAAGAIRMWESPNLVNWTEVGVVYQAPQRPGDWNQLMFWAAEIHVAGDGDFYLTYSASPDAVLQNHRIGIAHARAITGPYVDCTDGPLFDLGVETIDQHLVRCNGTPYLLYTNHHGTDAIYAVALADNYSAVVGPHIKLFERAPGETVCEAPWAFTHGGRWYILYSANGGNTVDYRVGYHVANALLGPYTRGEYALTKTRHVHGPGHCCVVPAPGGTEWFIVYQAKKNAEVNWERHVSIDRLHVAADGRLVVTGPTTCPQPVPAHPGPHNSSFLAARG